MNTAQLSRSRNQTKNQFSESWPPFINKLPIWVVIMSYFFLIWIFNTIYLCLLCNNYLYGGHEGQNTRKCFWKSPNLWSEMFYLSNFFPPNVVFCPKFCFFKMFVFFWNIKCCFPHFLCPNCCWFLKMLHFVTFCFVFDSFVFQNVSGFCDMLLFWPLRATLCLFYNVILCSHHPLSLLRSEGVIEYICL